MNNFITYKDRNNVFVLKPLTSILFSINTLRTDLSQFSRLFRIIPHCATVALILIGDNVYELDLRDTM